MKTVAEHCDMTTIVHYAKMIKMVHLWYTIQYMSQNNCSLLSRSKTVSGNMYFLYLGFTTHRILKCETTHRHYRSKYYQYCFYVFINTVEGN